MFRSSIFQNWKDEIFNQKFSVWVISLVQTPNCYWFCVIEQDIPSVSFLHRNFVISFFQYVLCQSRELSSILLFWWNQANLTSSSFTLSHARCSGQAFLGFVSVAAAFLADLSDGLSFLLNEFKSGWHAVKLKSNIRILCWAEAHPKNVCGLVCAFPLYLHPRKWVLKWKNLVLGHHLIFKVS